MGKFVQPKVYLLGFTEVDSNVLYNYLTETDQLDFWDSFIDAKENGISVAEALCSFFAKLCYKSLVLGKNANISKTRDIPDNIKSCFDSGHGSVFEHVNFNFVITNCSRVFTHELVRHRVGTAFSQTSGRYCRLDEIDLVVDPILEPVKEHIKDIQFYLENKYALMCEVLGLNDSKLNFDEKKKLTSALRRIAPNGQSNEIGFSVNLRALRQLVQIRTAKFAEWEIRFIFAQIYNLIKDKFPLVFYGAKEEIIDGIVSISGMKLQPWEK